ncbi:precorrin-6A/cobalt-precorrin-6A reductase [Aliiroseovarius sp. Z3]|uniref:precorrin-6A/cobalt-precorrin-6A reductase n=1 Tax=Aliiroseovarius sp. Z3 TaxID=2811402 RepID=UPI0023B2E335|nr:precorrin-6A/cobalt-precorrin-6A reductase [Aliiroseovarius sp. Z3]MDE9449155.1 precorrin-6A/cobalt-precorrin-6A reductase [Aliiroseovarius sp. Z3]
MKILLMAGTSEARAVADRLAADGIDALASMAGVTDEPRLYPIQTRRGGFGGEDAQERFMITGKFDTVIDATHPFATRISSRTLAIARRLGLRYLRVLRPAWQAQDGDIWYNVTTREDVEKRVPKGARVFLATGAQSIDEWSELAKGRTLFCRRVDRTNDPFPYEGSWIIGQPPFVLAYEMRLMKTYAIDWVVARNSGGPTRAKLDAARALGRPVALLERPPMLDCDHVETPDEALAWLTKQDA